MTMIEYNAQKAVELIRDAIVRRDSKDYIEWMHYLENLDYAEYEDWFDAAVPVFDYGVMYDVDMWLADEYDFKLFGKVK